MDPQLRSQITRSEWPTDLHVATSDLHVAVLRTSTNNQTSLNVENNSPLLSIQESRHRSLKFTRYRFSGKKPSPRSSKVGCLAEAWIPRRSCRNVGMKSTKRNASSESDLYLNRLHLSLVSPTKCRIPTIRLRIHHMFPVSLPLSRHSADRNHSGVTSWKSKRCSQSNLNASGSRCKTSKFTGDCNKKIRKCRYGNHPWPTRRITMICWFAIHQNQLKFWYAFFIFPPVTYVKKEFFIPFNTSSCFYRSLSPNLGVLLIQGFCSTEAIHCHGLATLLRLRQNAKQRYDESKWHGSDLKLVFFCFHLSLVCLDGG